jgi:hypothetical protein
MDYDDEPDFVDSGELASIPEEQDEPNQTHPIATDGLQQLCVFTTLSIIHPTQGLAGTMDGNFQRRPRFMVATIGRLQGVRLYSNPHQ